MAPKAQTSDLTEVKLEVYYSGDAKFGEKPFEVLDVVFSIKWLVPKSHTCTVGLLYFNTNFFYKLLLWYYFI